MMIWMCPTAPDNDDMIMPDCTTNDPDVLDPQNDNVLNMPHCSTNVDLNILDNETKTKSVRSTFAWGFMSGFTGKMPC